MTNLSRPDAPDERWIPIATAVALARTCFDTGVPELTADLLMSDVTNVDEASERIVAAVSAKTVVVFPEPRPNPLMARLPTTTEAATANVRDHLVSSGALPDWSFLEKAG